MMNIFCGLFFKKNKLSNGRIADSQCDGLVSVIANTDVTELQQMLMDIAWITEEYVLHFR